MDIQNFLNRILFRVQCPSQYVGGEWNSIVKDWDKIKGDICFCFPDTYSVGMSNQGLKLLYEIVNDCSDLVCERAFAPLPDMIEFLRQENVSLFSLESNRALCDFHVVGFSIGSNQNWTNVLEMLDLGKIAVWAKDRGEEEPIIIAGGHGVYNVEPGADFLDLVALGDGEELLVEVLRLDATLREQGVSRRERIRKIACDISGVYAPAFYHVSYYDNGTVATIMPEQGMPSLIVSRVLENFEKFKYKKPIVGLNDTVHNRIFLEIMRGCTRGCRFCQASMIRRPLRIKSVEHLLQEAISIYENTGYEEISLYSLSSSDYPYLEELAEKLTEYFKPLGVSLSLPSLRINEQLKILPKIVATVRKSGLTLAPEVGSTHLQCTINKSIDWDELCSSIECAYQEGWNSVKLYFMIGLPEETKEDLDGIVDLLHRIGSIRKQNGYLGNVTASISSFVPKANTPFQWASMATTEYLQEAQFYIRHSLRLRNVRVNFHNVNLSLLEGLISKGNRKISKVIYDAWKNGAYLDSWNEYFRLDAWEKAISDNNIDLNFYLHREIPLDEILPWMHLSSGVSDEFLRSEWQKSKKGELTPYCTLEGCNGCGVDAKICFRRKQA
ncbi:MAG: TIGR03960 family B12-binding radical SAM protein [Planctomycetes bacterium]|jgi:radical SAM family uncharacterized protein|nr:TIGR03960 family B12-binding radical SAM protein [Planctomycetota bacterium]HON45333.1 TIGR03960 family B12-binding radical SAM protein [Planctomycetota bacterium]HPY74657.1 TIGR03960 family B12-binding radical SAM protein [Planctomycetota bacterium]HQB01584.1 TIGR03960 family B12-binding radical SAM protein [Planctomycetota bacterium]HRU52530.1 TIGR03960 family B12-binding radical SAM protein [Planctomycetota bacterium]